MTVWTPARQRGEGVVRRSPDSARPAAVLGPDGRVESFDGVRLAASLRRALVDSRDAGDDARVVARAADLATVIELYLTRAEQGPLVGREEVIALGRRVLSEAGHEAAAFAYRTGRSRRPSRAAPGLVASPLSIAELLSDGVPGSAVEQRLAGTLLREHALHHVMPSDAVAAQEDGWVDFVPWLAGARVVDAVLPRVWLADQGGGRTPRSAILGAALRPLAGLVTNDLVLPWDGPLPGRRAAIDLGHQLVTSDPSVGRVVLSLPALRLRELGGLLEALAGEPRARWAVRLHGPSEDPAALARLAAGNAVLEVCRAAPLASCVSAAARIDLAGLAKLSGARRASAFLDLVDQAARLALRGLSAWADSEPVAAARRVLAPDLGVGCAEQVRLQLSGWGEARRLLLGDGRRARANADDLAAALGERLARLQPSSDGCAVVVTASGGSTEEAVDVARLASLLGLYSGAPLPIPADAAEHFETLLVRSPSLAGSGPCV